MELVRKLERTLADFHKKQLPHLPVNGRTWLSKNIWWITLILVVIAAVGVFTILGAAFFTASLLGAYGGVFGLTLGGIAFIAVLIGLAFSIAQVVLLGMAVGPLKAMRKKGWDLVFLTIVLSVVAAIVSLLLQFNILGLFLTVVWAAAEAYFLFEIRSHFVGATIEGEVIKKSSVRKKSK